MASQLDFKVLDRSSFVRLDYNFQDAYKAGPTFGGNAYNPYTLNKPSNEVLNLRAGMTFDKIDLSIFANNLANSHDPVGNAGNGITQCTAAGGEGCTVFTGYTPIVAQPVQRPRTLGVQASYKF